MKLRLLAVLALFVLVRPTVAGGPGQHATVPDCIRTCTPHITEQGIVWECTLDCVIDSVEQVFDLAANDGDPYIPRFGAPSCPGSCPIGEEEFEFSAGEIVPLFASLWAVPNGGWHTGPNNITSVSFAIVRTVETLVESDFEALPWVDLGTAISTLPGSYELLWPSAGFDDPSGYLLRVDMEDSVLGTLTGITIARDSSTCGHHEFGVFAPGTDPGANVLSLSVSGGDQPGTSFITRTSGVTDLGAYTWITAGGADLKLLGGRLWVDPSQHLAITFTPAVGGAVHETFAIPPITALAGVRCYVQTLAKDGAQSDGWAFSNGVRTTICP